MVALSRLYLGYHWLTDVLASMGLALAVTGIVILADGLRATMAPRSGRLTTRQRPLPFGPVLAESDPSEPDAHRLGDHHRRG